MLQGNARSGLIVLITLAALAACGGGGEEAAPDRPPQLGGGGGAGVPPPIAASPAFLGRVSTREIAASVMAELDLAEKPSGVSYLPEIVARARAVLANVEDPCPEGGSLRESQRLDDDLTGTIDIVFSDCIEGGTRQSGALTIHIEKFDVASRTATQYRLDFGSLTFSSETRSAVAQGAAAVSIDEGSETIAYQVTGSYSPEAVSVRLEDLVVTAVTDPSGARRESFAGRLTHSQHGYVDVSTLEELGFAGSDTADPASGALRLTGALNSTADLRFEGPRVHIHLDADGDGSADATLTTTWLELRDVSNLPPSANAGEDGTIELGATATADASRSIDWEGDALTYEWRLTLQPQGSSVEVTGSSPSVSFRPDVAGEYELQVTVRDPEGNASSDRVRISVRAPGPVPPNLRPTADAGSDRITVERQSVTLDGSRSRDPENDPLRFSWQLVRAPQGSAARISGDAASVDFTPDLPGVYDLRLTVTDGRSSHSDTVRVLADRLVRFTSGVEFSIRGRSLRGDHTKAVALRTSPHYRGAPVQISVSENAPWLIVSTPAVSSAPPGASVLVQLRLDLGVVEDLRRGTYEAELVAVPAGERLRAVADVTLRRR